MQEGADRDAAATWKRAVDWLRKKGLAAAAKKAGRVAAEGLVGVASAQGKAARWSRSTAETDFVARNETFQALRRRTWPSVGARGRRRRRGDPRRRRTPAPAAPSAEELTQLVATIGENMNLRRAGADVGSDGVVASYVAQRAAPGLGKIGVLVGAGGRPASSARARTLGRQIAHARRRGPAGGARHRGASIPAALERERTC